VGVGVGGRDEDYRAAGAPWEGRVRRLGEQVALMRRAWAGETVVPGGAPLGPPPRQPGGPEILAGVLLPSAIRRAARWADGLCGFSFGPDEAEIRASFAVAREAWAARGRPAPRLVTSCWFALGAAGPATMDAYVRRYLDTFGTETAASLATLCTTTSAAALRGVIGRIQDTGADELIPVPTTA